MLEDYTQAQVERLGHIDFQLYFLGELNRNSLIHRFKIKEAAASRDVALYKKLAPNNAWYDTKAKAYRKSSEFKPLFDHSFMQSIESIAFGTNSSAFSPDTPFVCFETASRISKPNTELVSKISQAIYQNKAASLIYNSITSGKTARVIIPFALVDSGKRWHVRAYDRLKERFSDFVINRISEFEILEDEEIDKNETYLHDEQWQRLVNLELTAHPSIKHQETIEKEYSMTDGVLTVKLRAALVGYFLNYWSIDITSDHSLDPNKHQLWLQNSQSIYGVENIHLA